jgi:YhcH/YjgK/YiaL family protein
MIYSSIYADDDCSKYPAAIQRAIEYLKTTDILSMAQADYPIEGDKMFVKVFDNTSKTVAETHPELHKKYIDVQFWVTGGELMGIYPKKKEYEVVETHEDQDLYFLGDVEGEQFLRMEKGDYIILFPNDVHRPGIAEKEPQTYRKAVVKVSMDLL